MENKSDTLLRRKIKNWANHKGPPSNGRARLLWEAAQAPRNKYDISSLFIRRQYKTNPSPYSNDRMQSLFTWINENSFQYGLKARLS